MRCELTLILCADLKEVRKLLGVKYCPNCSVGSDYSDRRRKPLFERSTLHDLVQEARELRLTGASNAAVMRVLKLAGLSLAHVYAVCPVLKLPHFSLAGFVPERLHERYAAWVVG